MCYHIEFVCPRPSRVHINRGETQDLGPMGPRILHLLKYILKVFKKNTKQNAFKKLLCNKKIRSNLCFQDKNSIFKCVLCSSLEYICGPGLASLKSDWFCTSLVRFCYTLYEITPETFGDRQTSLRRS